MPGTFSQMLYHIVFATKRRTPFITKDVASRLYAYIGGVIRENGGILHAIGGMPDHVHLLVCLRPRICVSDLMCKLKSRSSQWVHNTYPRLDRFAWQEGYSIFSVSRSQKPTVRRYIERQADHHRTEDFTSELRRLLTAHGMEFEERFLID